MAAATALLLGVVACSDLQEPLVARNDETATALSVNVGQLSLGVGEAGQLVVSEQGSGSAVVQGVKWTSSNPDVAQVDAAGRVFGIMAGASQVTASRGGASVTTAVTVVETGTAPVGVLAAVVSTSNVDRTSGSYPVRVSPSTVTMDVRDTVRLQALHPSTGQLLNGYSQSWVSSNGLIARVDSRGLVTGVAAGTATIQVTVAGTYRGLAQVTVRAPVAVAQLTASPQSYAFGAVGQTAQLSASARDAAGNPVSGTTLTWTSTNAAAVSVDANGLITARGAGSAQVIVRAACCTVADTVPVTVTLSQGVVRVVTSPSSHTFSNVGEAVRVSASALDATGATVAASITWSSTNAGVATVDNAGNVVARAAGTALVIARAACCTAADTTAITVNAPPAPVPPPSTGTALFADGFENYANGANIQGQGANGFRWGAAAYARASSDIARTGTRSLKFFFGPTEPDGSSHWWSEQRFDLGSLATEFWLEFYVYLPNGSEGLGSAAYVHSSAQNNKLTSLWGYPVTNPADGQGGYNNGAFILFQTWGINGGPEAAVNLNVQDRYPGGSTAIFTNARRGTWVQWRQHSRMSSARDRADGLVEYWINGQLGQRHANIVVQPTTTAYSHGWRYGYLMGYDNARFTQNTWIYVDDIRFYTTNPGW